MQDKAQLISYNFTVSDSILNVGPIVDVYVGEFVDQLSDVRASVFLSYTRYRSNYYKRKMSIWSRALDTARMEQFVYCKKRSDLK